MKSFLLKSLLFLALLVITIFVMNTCVTIGMRKSDNGWSQMYSKNLNYDVIFSGNSRSLVHLNPAVFDSMLHVNSFNISMDGNSFESQIIRLRVYLNNNPAPKLIVLNIDPYELQPTLLSNAQSYKPYMYDTTVYNQLKRLDILPWYYYNPLTDYYGDYVSVYEGLMELSGIKHFKEPFQKGFLPENRVFNFQELRLLEKSPPEYISVNSRCVSLFESFIFDCKRNNIEVLLIQSPIYFVKQQKMKNYDLFNNEILKRAKFLNIEYFDFTKDSLCYSTDYFNNTLHLNETGSTILCKKICRRIKNSCILMKKLQQ